MRKLWVATAVVGTLVSARPGVRAAVAEPDLQQEQPAAPAGGNPSPATAASDPALALAHSLVQQGKLDEAEQFLHHFIDEHPNSAEAHFLLGYTYFQQVHLQASLEAPEAQKFFSLEVDAPVTEAKAKASLAEYTAGARYHDPGAVDLKVVALDYVLLKDYADADKWLTRSVIANPKDAESWYYLGRTKYNENRFEEAIAAFRQYLKLEPGSVKGEDNLGLSYQGLGRTEDAISAFKTAIAWQKDLLNQDCGPFVNLGAILLDENQLEQAVSYLVQAVSICPHYAPAREQLGKAYDRLGELAKAQAELEKAVELAPRNARLHYILGQIYRKRGFTDKARLELDRSASLRLNKGSEGNDE